MITVQSKHRLVDSWLRHESLWLRLFVNDAPSSADKVDDYDEMTGHAYAPKVIAPDEWRVTDDPKGNVIVEAVGKVWTFEGGMPTTIYGYLLEGRVTGLLYWAEKFMDGMQPEPCLITREGERLRVIARCVFPVEE
jgi:hypothetical protein